MLLKFSLEFNPISVNEVRISELVGTFPIILLRKLSNIAEYYFIIVKA